MIKKYKKLKRQEKKRSKKLAISLEKAHAMYGPKVIQTPPLHTVYQLQSVHRGILDALMEHLKLDVRYIPHPKQDESHYEVYKQPKKKKKHATK